MRIYNTLTREKEELIPQEEGHFKIYACGPTVYNYIHIGNARPICVFEVLRRYLEYRGNKVTFVQNFMGYKVKYVQNFTDIDDKIIKKANEEGTDYLTVSKKYIEEYWKDADGLNVGHATVHPLATENMDEIIHIIADLLEKGYVAENGDVYFRTKKFDEYGKLSHQPLDDLQSGARISVGEMKEDAMDFAVWKAAKEGEPYWEAPWSKGRPGWHIECSAMARRYLGETIDVHCGGQDLIFPHHENEIAQSECCNGKIFARYWMHNGYINVDNHKMSKSLNNFFTVRDVAEKYGYEPIRYLMVASHYRSPINYSTEIIEQCKAALDRLYNCRENLTFLLENAEIGKKEGESALKEKFNRHEAHFIEVMDDDLNTADAISALFDLAKDINTHLNASSKPSKEICQYALDMFNRLADVLGLLYSRKEQSLDEEIEAFIAQRTKARAEKDWETADRIRDELKARHVVLEDTPQGIKWRIEE